MLYPLQQGNAVLNSSLRAVLFVFCFSPMRIKSDTQALSKYISDQLNALIKLVIKRLFASILNKTASKPEGIPGMTKSKEKKVENDQR